jgi:hypothetical protein
MYTYIYIYIGETLCGLSGHFMIYQYTKGHRFTTDDVCTAYFAVNEMRDFILDKNKVHYISLFYDVFWSIIALFVDGSVCF